MTPAEAIETQGYWVFRGVLSPAEVAEARRICLDHVRRYPVVCSHLGMHDFNVAAKRPDLRWLFAHPAVLDVVRKSVGSDHPVFTVHSDLAVNRLSGWHKDSEGYFAGDYLPDRGIKVIKLALYLQDHLGDDTGLTIEPGSQFTPGMNQTTPMPVETRAGDIVAFDVRLNHVGRLPDKNENRLMAVARRLGFPKVHPKAFAHAESAYFKLKGRTDRCSLFFTYGAPNERTTEFASKTQLRQNEQLANANRPPETGKVDPRLVEALKAGGVDCWQPARGA